MDKTHYERRSHEQGNYEIIPTYTDQIVVTIKSLATGQTMKVYLDEPTQEVFGGINVTRYEGHFYEEEFMVTMSEGIEFIGLPLMYPYSNMSTKHGEILVIDTENHYQSVKIPNSTDPINFVEAGTFSFGFSDFISNDDSEILPDSRNAVTYTFTRVSGTSLEPGEPIVVPVNPGTDPRE